MLNRIQRVMDYYKLTSSAFADKIGVPRSTISHILSGRNNPSLDFVMKTLARFPQVNIDWLINGIGPMLKVSSSLFPDENLDEFPKKDFEVNQPPSHSEIDALNELGKGGLEFAPREEVNNNSTLISEKQYDNDSKLISEKQDDNDSKLISEKQDDYHTIVRSEDPVEYGVSTKNKKATSTKVIIIYDDGTFSEYTPR